MFRCVKRNKIRPIFLILFFTYLANQGVSQILDNSLFKIYRASFVQGAVTHLRMNKDQSFEMSVSEIHCSLCDYDELKERINSKGIWIQRNDTIFLKAENRNGIELLIIDNSLLIPIYPLTLDCIAHPQTPNQTEQGSSEDFYLIYDTYSNGVAKLIIDKYRMKRGEYMMEFSQDGTLTKVNYYWDGKESNRIR